MSNTLMQNSFNAGVLSPRLGGRVDLQKYMSALGTCENALPQPWGGVTRRMGTEFINACSVSNKRSRLIPFRYSTEQAYIIEAGHEYMRFYMDGGLIQTNDASTVALLHLDGISASQSFDDSSTYDKTVTAYGNVKVDASDGVFNECAIFDGSGDYLSMADSAHFNMATYKFCYEERVKFSALPADNQAMVIYSQRADSHNSAVFSLANRAGVYSFSLLLNTDSVMAYPVNKDVWAAPVVDTWYHLGLIRGWTDHNDKWATTINGATLGETILSTTYPDVTAAFQIGSGTSEDAYPPAQSDTYVKATTKFDVNYWPYFATDPTKSLLGTESGTSWNSVNGTTTNQRFHIDLGIAKIINRIYYENQHSTGADTTSGVKNFTFYGSNDAADFAALNYASTGTWISLNTATDMFAKHSALNAVDPQYINVTNDTAYRYYGFKFADNWGGALYMGFRRVELKPMPYIDFNGKKDEIRISKDTPRYTTSFTPPTVAYPLGTSGGNDDFSISSSYGESDLRDIYYSQSADTLYLAHPDYAPATLVRADHDDWTLATITFAWPPFQDENTTSTELDPNAASVGAVSLVASTSMFNDNHVGSYYKLNSGYMNVSSVQSATTCSGTIIDEFINQATTVDWAKSAWDAISGYPSCVTFFEQRLSFGASSDEEQTIWMSVSGDFYNFNEKVGSTIADTDACTYTLDADEVNKIHFLVPSKKLVAGTEGGIFLISGNQDDGVTPSNIKVRVEAAEQAADECMPVRFGNSVLFAERGKHIIREFAYNFQSDSYEAKDLIILAEHLTRNNSIVEMALQRIPFKVLWCVLDDGHVISLTYLKEHDVVGWTWHDFGGDAESVACIPGTTDDEVWFIIKRTVSGSVVRYIERLKPSFTGEAEEDAFYVDSGLTYDGSPTTSISGLTHLVGETVMFLADGNINEATVVNASGKIFLDSSASVVQVGLPMTTKIETLRVSPQQYQGKEKRISYVTMRFFETAGDVQYGIPTKLDTLNVGTDLFTDDERFTFPSGYDEDGKITIQKTDSFPMTVLAIIPDIEMYRG